MNEVILIDDDGALTQDQEKKPDEMAIFISRFNNNFNNKINMKNLWSKNQVKNIFEDSFKQTCKEFIR